MPPNKLTTRQVRLTKIIIPASRRPTKPAKVRALVESIREIGLLEPIGVTKEKRLVYGRRRCEACSKLGWETIPAVTVSLNGLRLELAEIDENIQRKQLSKLEESKALARRKEIYESLHPETKQGTAGGKASGASRRGEVEQATDCRSFAEDTAAATGKSKRTIQRDVAVANAIPEDVRAMISNLPIANNKSELARLSKLSRERQYAIIPHLLNGGISRVPPVFCECGGFLFDGEVCRNCARSVEGAGYGVRVPDKDDDPEPDVVDLPDDESKDTAVANAIPAKAISNNKSDLTKLSKLPVDMQRDFARRMVDDGNDAVPNTADALTRDELEQVEELVSDLESRIWYLVLGRGNHHGCLGRLWAANGEYRAPHRQRGAALLGGPDGAALRNPLSSL